MIELSKYTLDTLRNDKEFNLYRGWSADDNSQILVLSPVAEYPAPEILKRLEHEYALREELDPAWAARPIKIGRHWDRTVLVLEDPGGAPLNQLLGEPLDLAFSLRAAVGLSSVIDRLHQHDMPVHHLLEQILNEYIEAAGLQSGQPLFQSVNSAGTKVTGRALNRYNVWAAIRKRAKAAGFLTPVGCHTWRATGITIYLENDGRLEHAQQMAGHESPRTTKLYDRTKDEITLSEVERIRL